MNLIGIDPIEGTGFVLHIPVERRIGDVDQLRHTREDLGRVGRPLELGDIDLAHLEHRLHGAARTLRIGISNQLVQLARHDLPRQAESVLEPSARPRLASVRRERIPQPVDLLLVLALDDERHRLVEAEIRSAVEALEVLAIEREIDRQDHPGRPAGRVGRGAPDLVDAAARQQARVEPGRLLSLAVEPETGKGVAHLCPPVRAPLCHYLITA